MFLKGLKHLIFLCNANKHSCCAFNWINLWIIHRGKDMHIIGPSFNLIDEKFTEQYCSHWNILDYSLLGALVSLTLKNLFDEIPVILNLNTISEILEREHFYSFSFNYSEFLFGNYKFNPYYYILST